MLLKFIGKTMPKYAGVDGKGGSVVAERGQVVEVSEMVGKMLLRAYGENFEPVSKDQDQIAEHAPKQDKFLRKSKKTRTKSRKE